MNYRSTVFEFSEIDSLQENSRKTEKRGVYEYNLLLVIVLVC